MTYEQFLETKRKSVIKSGFDIELNQLNDKLFDFQKFTVQRALNAGKYAIFADTGQGKTPMQLEIAKQVNLYTNKPVLILAPLAVTGQTIEQGVKFGVEVKRFTEPCNINIANYEQLENIDYSKYGCVCLDECFAPDTKIKVLVNNSMQEKHIKDCKAGEIVLNCTGFDNIKAIRRKKITKAIKLSFNGKTIICSQRHPFFTQRGWVAAKELLQSDFIISTDKAMRILREGVYTELQKQDESILRDILLSEVANGTTGNKNESSFDRSSQKNRIKEISMVQNTGGRKGVGTNNEAESNAESINEVKSIIEVEGNKSQTFSAWGKWSRNDITSAINEGCFVRRLDSGICYISGETSEGLPDSLQSRFSELRNEDSDRGGWELTSQQKRERQKEGRKTGFFGLESFEVLEQTDTRLDKYRDESGSLYFYDIEIERHPSFTINECLVHNSSILKNETGSYRNLIIETFKNTPYKFCFSATPSPNDPMELGNHSEFLDVMTYNEMLAMFFVNDQQASQKWRLKGHAVERFYEFVSTWAIMYSHPRDIGFEQDGYDLPKLNIIERQVSTPLPEGCLFAGTAVNATDYNQSLRDTEKERVSETMFIIENEIPENEQIIIWTKQNKEAEYIYSCLNSKGYNCRNVQGSDSVDKKERDLLGFAHGEFRILITKLEIASQGLNYQNCGYQIFNSIDFSFEKTYQGMRRSWRYGRIEEVYCYMITTDRMINVTKIQDDKQKAFQKMQYEMAKAVNRNLNNQLTTRIMNTEDVKTDKYWVMKGDCVARIMEVPDKSVDLIVFSPPFADLYTYSNYIEDMGNVKDYDEFISQFKYLVNELKRVIKPGRIIAVHCMDLPTLKSRDGYIGIRRFSAMIGDIFESFGLFLHSEFTIWKDPLLAAVRTKTLGLAHKQLLKDSSMIRAGLPDRVLCFKTKEQNEVPIEHDLLDYYVPMHEFDTFPRTIEGFNEFYGYDPESKYSKAEQYSQHIWQRYASPIWMDIDQTNTLQFMNARDSNDEKHICPLQLGVIERIIKLYSRKGETVLSPFGGIGSEGYQALKMGRKSISIELKDSYFEINKRNHTTATEEKGQLTLF